MLWAVAAASPCTISKAGTTVMAKAPPTMLIRYRAPAILASWRGEAAVTESITDRSRLVKVTRGRQDADDLRASAHGAWPCIALKARPSRASALMGCSFERPLEISFASLR